MYPASCRATSHNKPRLLAAACGIHCWKFYDEIGFKYSYRESNGGHSRNNWRLYLTELAPMLFE